MSDETDRNRIVQLLEEVRDNQQMQLERQAEAFALEKQQREFPDTQMEHAEKLQDREEFLHRRNSRALKIFRAFIFSVLAVVGVLLIFVAWITFETR